VVDGHSQLSNPHERSLVAWNADNQGHQLHQASKVLESTLFLENQRDKTDEGQPQFVFPTDTPQKLPKVAITHPRRNKAESGQIVLWIVKTKKRQDVDVTELSPNKRFPKNFL